MHLEKDITLLGRALGKSVDEAVLIMHLILQDILVKDIPKCKHHHVVCAMYMYITMFSIADSARGLGTLAQRTARDSWETLINQTYVQPFLKVCIIHNYMYNYIATAIQFPPEKILFCQPRVAYVSYLVLLELFNRLTANDRFNRHNRQICHGNIVREKT